MPTLVVSDVHLATVGAPGRAPPHRQPSAQVDEDLADLVRGCIAAGARGVDVVLAGDVFDFDAPDFGPDAGDGTTPDGAAARLVAILDDHPAVVDALHAVLATGGRVVVLPGNHDAALVFPEVRRVLTSALAAGARGQLPGRVAFRAWFHLTPGGLYVEHGHLYDAWCTLADPLGASGRIEPTIGSVLARRLAATFPCADPYAVDPFAFDLPAAAACGTVTGSPAMAALRVLAELEGIDVPITDGREALARVAAAETGAPLEACRRAAAGLAVKTTAGAFLAGHNWHGYAARVDAAQRASMARAAAIHGARAVVMGHTHAAWSSVANGVLLGNTGTWAPRGAGRASGPVGHFAWFGAGRDGVYPSPGRRT